MGASQPLQPAFVTSGIISTVRLDQWMLKTVVYVGSESSDGRFLPLGTGFLVARHYEKWRANLIVTAAHVLELIPGDKISYRMNRHTGEAGVLSVPRARIVEHPDPETDLAAFFVGHTDDIFDGKYYLLDRAVNLAWLNNYGGVHLGDEVAIVGLYTTHYGLTKNVPVARTGNVAAFPDEPINCMGKFVRGLLVEVRSVGGLSGSPVFYGVPPAFRKDDFVHHAPKGDYQPIGILLGHHIVTSEEDELPAPVFQHEKSRAPPPPRLDRNTGLGVVVPLERVFEIVESEKFTDMCAQAAKEHEAKSGYKPDSAAPLPVPLQKDGEEGSQHKEAFTSLLNAAVKTKSQGD